MGNKDKQPSNSDFKAPRRNIKVGTLNYCGIAHSPFQFYCKECEKELLEISKIFRSLIPKYFPKYEEKTFKWTMGKVDKIFKKNRYSNIFYENVGYFFKKFLNKEQFQAKWEEQWQNNVSILFGQDSKKQKKDEKPSEAQKQELKLYDFMFYHALLIFVYKTTEDFNELIKNDPKFFEKTMKPFYELSFLNENKKLAKFMQGFQRQKFDILFIQEYSPILEQHFNTYEKQHYAIFKDPYEDSMIILKKQSFVAIDGLQQIKEKQAVIKQYFKWAENLVYVIADQYIIICVHLSSSQKKFQKQLAQLQTDMTSLKGKLKNYEFIVGGDFNVFVPKFQNFELFPSRPEQYTTHKKRTSMQAQFHKSQLQVKESKDKIMSTLKISQEKSSITLFDNTPSNEKSFIPSDEHPFDISLLKSNLSNQSLDIHPSILQDITYIQHISFHLI